MCIICEEAFSVAGPNGVQWQLPDRQKVQAAVQNSITALKLRAYIDGPGDSNRSSFSQSDWNEYDLLPLDCASTTRKQDNRCRHTKRMDSGTGTDDRSIETFTLPLSHVDTLHLSSVKCPRKPKGGKLKRAVGRLCECVRCHVRLPTTSPSRQQRSSGMDCSRRREDDPTLLSAGQIYHLDSFPESSRDDKEVGYRWEYQTKAKRR